MSHFSESVHSDTSVHQSFVELLHYNELTKWIDSVKWIGCCTHFRRVCYSLKVVTLVGEALYMKQRLMQSKSSSLRSVLTHFTKIPLVCVKDSSRSQCHIPDHRQHVSAVASVCNANFPALKYCITWSGRWPQVHIPTRCFHRLEFLSCLFLSGPRWSQTESRSREDATAFDFPPPAPADVGTFPMLVVVQAIPGLHFWDPDVIVSKARDSSSKRSVDATDCTSFPATRTTHTHVHWM